MVGGWTGLPPRAPRAAATGAFGTMLEAQGTQLITIAAKEDPNALTVLNRHCGLFRRTAEKLGDALGWTPTLGMIGGPEFGTMADGKCAVGTYMYSTVVFSSVPVGVPFGSGTFASGGKVSMQVSKSGAVLHAVNEDEDEE